MAKTSGGGGAKRPAKKKIGPATKTFPKPRTRAATSTPRTPAAPKAPSLPSSPNILRNSPVPQWTLFSGIGRTIQQATGQGKGRARKRR